MARMLDRIKGTIEGYLILRTFKEDLLPDQLQDIVEIDQYDDQWIVDNWEQYFISLNRPYVITRHGLITTIWI